MKKLNKKGFFFLPLLLLLYFSCLVLSLCACLRNWLWKFEYPFEWNFRSLCCCCSYYWIDGLKENIENVLRYPGVLFGELIMSHLTSEPHHRSPLCLSIQLESFSLFYFTNQNLCKTRRNGGHSSYSTLLILTYIFFHSSSASSTFLTWLFCVRRELFVSLRHRQWVRKMFLRLLCKSSSRPHTLSKINQHERYFSGREFIIC